VIVMTDDRCFVAVSRASNR